MVLPWLAPTHKVIETFGHVVLQDHETHQNHYISTTTAYDCQTWQNGNLSWWAPTQKVKWPFDHMVLLDHVIN